MTQPTSSSTPLGHHQPLAQPILKAWTEHFDQAQQHKKKHSPWNFKHSKLMTGARQHLLLHNKSSYTCTILSDHWLLDRMEKNQYTLVIICNYIWRSQFDPVLSLLMHSVWALPCFLIHGMVNGRLSQLMVFWCLSVNTCCFVCGPVFTPETWTHFSHLQNLNKVFHIC